MNLWKQAGSPEGVRQIPIVPPRIVQILMAPPSVEFLVVYEFNCN